MSRHPLWDQDLLPVGSPGGDETGHSLGVEGALDREVTVSTGLDALVEGGAPVPEPTAVPFVVAFGIALFLVGLLVSAVVVLVAGAAVGLGALATWTWRTERP
jgi:hypothetical protein